MAAQVPKDGCEVSVCGLFVALVVSVWTVWICV